MIAPFEASRIKLGRATRHLQELRDEIDGYFARDGVAVMSEADPRYLPDVVVEWRLRFKEPFPTAWSAIVGDIVHNLRSALDVMACDLVRLALGPDASLRDVHFPFSNSKDDLPGQIKNRRMHRCGPKVIAAIEHVAPYRGGNIGLRAIHDLDVMDKHTALVPVLSVATIPPFNVRFGMRDNPIPEWRAATHHDGQVMLVMPLAWSPHKAGTKVNATFEVLFGDDAGVFAQKDVVRQMDMCVDGVKRVLEFFEIVVADDAPSAGAPLGS